MGAELNHGLRRAPPGFQRWPLIWFQCPACGFHTFASLAKLGLPQANSPLFRFWCERCRAYSVQQGPQWKIGALLLAAIGVSAIALPALLEYLPLQSDIAVLIAFLVFIIVWAALNRSSNRYVRENQAFQSTPPM